MIQNSIQVMKVSDTLYVADLGGDNLVQVEMTGLIERDGKALKAYNVTSSNNKINGHFEHVPDGSPIELIQALVKVHLIQQEIKGINGVNDG